MELGDLFLTKHGVQSCDKLGQNTRVSNTFIVKSQPIFTQLLTQFKKIIQKHITRFRIFCKFKY